VLHPAAETELGQGTRSDAAGLIQPAMDSVEVAVTLSILLNSGNA